MEELEGRRVAQKAAGVSGGGRWKRRARATCGSSESSIRCVELKHGVSLVLVDEEENAIGFKKVRGVESSINGDDAVLPKAAVSKPRHPL